MSKTAATITMNTDVLARLRSAAEIEKRTVSQQLEMIVERHFKSDVKPTARKPRGGQQRKGV